jgi:hypothetical protein
LTIFDSPQVSAILLPSRLYQNFERVGRVIEKMIDYSNAAAGLFYGGASGVIDNSKLWSLNFRESEFLGEFIC